MTTPPESRRCIDTTAAGTPCKTAPLEGKERCYFHDPENAAARLLASKAGGERQSTKRGAETARLVEIMAAQMVGLPPVSITDPKSILALLSVTLTALRRGEMDQGIAKAIASLCTVALAALKSDSTDAKVAELEEAMRPFRSLPPETLLEIVRASRGVAPAEH